jgi:hypothetical protein
VEPCWISGGASAFMEVPMTNEQKRKYNEPELLRNILERVLKGKKFRLECGHYVSFGHNLGNDITIYNGREFKIICSQCGY